MKPSSRLRLAVPAVAVVAVAGAVAVPALASSSPGALAPKTATQLLDDVAGSRTTALSGTVVQTSRLGLPQLPSLGGAGGGTGPTDLLTGSHTLRVWADGPDHTRLALLGPLAEYDVVHSGRDVWTYSSAKNAAVHYTLPAGSADKHAAEPLPSGAPTTPTTPAQAVDQVLAAIDPTTTVRVDQAVTVAGRDARQLVLEPRDTASLVGSVRVAVDSVTSSPLRMQVFAKADPTTPAFEVGFTDVSFQAPAASVFAFSAPAGAKVTDKSVAGETGGKHGAEPAGSAQPKVIGKGWTSIAVLSGVDQSSLTGADPKLLNSLTTKVPQGRLFTSALLSVLLTNDGRLLVGAVSPQALQAAA